MCKALNVAVQKCINLCFVHLLCVEELEKAENERRQLAEQVKKLMAEVEDVKTAAAIQEVGKEDEIARARRQHEEELASIQQIMEGNLYQLITPCVVV